MALMRIPVSEGSVREQFRRRRNLAARPERLEQVVWYEANGEGTPPFVRAEKFLTDLVDLISTHHPQTVTMRSEDVLSLVYDLQESKTDEAPWRE